jgi:selenide,water dikinase
LGPGDLAEALSGLTVDPHPDLIVGLDGFDDAGVFRLNNELALVQTLDFFTPIVDDPFTFGQIAVANALSDVYAMGGKPLTALNIVCFPHKKLNMSVLTDILRGGLDKLKEAGVALVGGHSVQDPELKYGLSVTGVIHPDKVLTNTGARAGDRLVLTKALGTGIVTTAVKEDAAADAVVAEAITSMSALNREAARSAIDHSAHAMTDVTGFGLIGHAVEMLNKTGLGLALDAAALPLFPGLPELCKAGMQPGGLNKNRTYRENRVDIDSAVPPHVVDAVWDPQTSGGLLIAMSPGDAADYIKSSSTRVPGAVDIGVFVTDKDEKITLG